MVSNVVRKVEFSKSSFPHLQLLYSCDLNLTLPPDIAGGTITYTQSREGHLVLELFNTKYVGQIDLRNNYILPKRIGSNNLINTNVNTKISNAFTKKSRKLRY